MSRITRLGFAQAHSSSWDDEDHTDNHIIYRDQYLENKANLEHSREILFLREAVHKYFVDCPENEDDPPLNP